MCGGRSCHGVGEDWQWSEKTGFAGAMAVGAGVVRRGSWRENGEGFGGCEVFVELVREGERRRILERKIAQEKQEQERQSQVITEPNKSELKNNRGNKESVNIEDAQENTQHNNEITNRKRKDQDHYGQ
ncbi:hypothetical protein HAX54_001586 [Datura stramonium]|uniref:Uncharacterized protein n=1 Tax=Datura stramonium TaxID=4076 RepID=A0ABS8T2J2_DATST|nr:hypothetical protein [Datura stramonium]